MSGTLAPVLDLAEARAEGSTGLPMTLTLQTGQLALIECGDPDVAAEFFDLCSGMVRLASGSVRFLGHDWTTLDPQRMAALRGRIGRVFSTGGWLDFLGADLNVLLPQLHHTRTPEAELRDAAARLARRFGLPGLPVARVSALHPADLARVACVRALLGRPDLILLESPLRGRYPQLIPPLLNALAAARGHGAAAIWITTSELVWNDPAVPVAQRLRLTENGLFQVRTKPRRVA